MTRAAAGAAAALALWAAGCSEGDSADPPAGAATAPAARAPAALPEEVPGRGSLTAHVRRAKFLWRRPGGGKRLARMTRRTKFDSPRIVSVVGRRGDWLAVLAPELPNGRVGWIDGRRGVSLYRTPWSIEADVSRRQLVVRRDGRVVRRVPIAVGRPGAPTPRGRFAVTDRLTTGNDFGPYGCCVLALTGHQPSVPQGWGGGDRLAIHATPAEQTIGHAASLGCLRARNADMRRLIRVIPLGTPVRIRD
jgi:L,D-transpeptidase-like protein